MADFAQRAEFERKIARALGKTMAGQLADLLDKLGDPPNLNNLASDYWEQFSELLRGAIQPILESAMVARVSELLGERSIGFDVAIANQRAAAWARQYTFELVSGITNNTRDALREQIAGFFEDQRTIGDLKESIARLFGAVRAEMIAITETTRAASEAEQLFAGELEKLGLRTTQVWQTNNDDAVCPICGPLNQVRRGEGWTSPPPAHVRCRCWISTEVVNP